MNFKEFDNPREKQQVRPVTTMTPKELGDRIEKAKAKAYKRPDPIDISKLWTKEKPAVEAGYSGVTPGGTKVDYANMMFRGKEIDHNSIEYEMQDFSDMMFELHGAKYIDGTPLTDEELEEFEKTGELIDWVSMDYVSESVSEDAGELARLKELSGIEEGADFYGYYKDPKDPEGKTFTYPNNMEFKTPHRSNANARMLLSRIGLEPDFENTGSHLIDDFIKVTTNWLQTHEADKDTNEYDEVEMYHVEANRIKKTHPEVTHVGFN